MSNGIDGMRRRDRCGRQLWMPVSDSLAGSGGSALLRTTGKVGSAALDPPYALDPPWYFPTVQTFGYEPVEVMMLRRARRSIIDRSADRPTLGLAKAGL